MAKIKIAKENETEMKFGDFTYQVRDDTLTIGVSLDDKFRHLNPDEGGENSE